MTATYDLVERINYIVETTDFGTPSARKTGRDPRWPYVPIILTESGNRSTVLRGFAYETRTEAIRHAERHIKDRRRMLAENLVNPRYRALREQYGLPREL